MVQVDVFWSYGLGAGFALAAAHQLRRRAEVSGARRPQPPQAPGEGVGRPEGPEGVPADPYLTGAMLFCAAVFAPSGIWLLWAFPNWETMQVGSHSMPGWLVAAFAMTNTTQGVAGYLVTRRLIVAGRMRWAVLQAPAGYFAMFFILVHGWDGNGYRRFFSVDKAAYRNWAAGSVLSNVGRWLTSDVALTLYGMGVVMIPLMLLIMHRYHREGLRAAGVTGPSAAGAAGIVLGTILVGALGAAIATSLLIHLFASVTASTVLGWALGTSVAVPVLWFTAVRRGALLSRIARLLALPPEEPALPSGRVSAAV